MKFFSRKREEERKEKIHGQHRYRPCGVSMSTPIPLQSFRYGLTLVEVFAGWVRTTLPDGVQILAMPQTSEEDVARARSLGYADDVWAMTRDHDRFHALLAHAFG